MKIVIFGGTFDPVHGEHIKMVRGALKELSPDKLIVLPTFVPPHKADAVADSFHRLNMARLAFGFDGRIEVSDYEIERGGNSYSYLTVLHFRAAYPEAEIRFLIGGDSFFEFDGWRNPDVIAGNSLVTVVPRGAAGEKLIARNAAFEKKYGYRAKILSFCGDDTSSTYIRYCLMLGLKAGNIPEAVGEYIEKNGLYKGGEYFAFVRENLKERRLYHTAGVMEYALIINKQTRLDRDKLLTACLLHDVAKYMNPADYPGFTVPAGMPDSVVHAFLGEYVAENVLGIKDKDILTAIRYHTTGCAGMTALEKVVYTADLIERGRTYPGVEALREAVEKDFESGFSECMRQGYKHLKHEKQDGGVYYLTVEAYDYYREK